MLTSTDVSEQEETPLQTRRRRSELRTSGRKRTRGGLEAKERKSQELAGVHAFGVRCRGSDGSTPRHTGLLVTIPGPWHRGTIITRAPFTGRDGGGGLSSPRLLTGEDMGPGRW